jgi:hypothetical protein
MNPDKFKEEIEDVQVEEALRNFRLSIRNWSEQEFARPRAIERTRWRMFQAGFWRMIANPALGGTLAAALLIASVGVPVGIQQEHKIAAERQAALDQQKKELEQRLADEEAKKSAAANTVDDGAFLDDVDSDIAQATPDAMQPLASLMSDGPGNSSRR